MKLAGKVAIVTGSSRGIGKEIALVFAREGAGVVVTARTETEDPRLPGTIHDTVAEIEAAGGRALAVRADALSEEEISAVASRALEAFGRIDILVNNAAAAAHSMPLHDLPVKRWDLVMDVNVRGYFMFIKAVAPSMIERGAGNIINISSGAGDMKREPSGGGLFLAYGISKAAINRMTLGLSSELEGHGIAVNALGPSKAVATAATVAFMGGKVDPSWIGPEQIAQAALYIAGRTPGELTGWIGNDEELRQLTKGW